MITDPTGSLLVALCEPCHGVLYSWYCLLSVVCCSELTLEAYKTTSVNGQLKTHRFSVKVHQPFRQCQCVHEDYLRMHTGSHSCSLLYSDLYSVTCTLLAKEVVQRALSLRELQIFYLKFCRCSCFGEPLQLSRISGLPTQQHLIYVSYVVSIMQKEESLIQSANFIVRAPFQVLV